jgi:hypothetical protein
MPADDDRAEPKSTREFGMPHALAFAIVGAGLYAGLRLAADRLRRVAEKAQSRADAEARARNAGVTAARDAGSLVWDEQAGVYRPK